ncbi:MAG: (d)CMP kinase [Planctomycetota bacterium]|jgi:cytidylate kinase|nr:(d)CMP kinase [Planctomycetota bacterium]MDA1201655.1 (d)CMP kinase [Planctomycetota bacterium]
MIVTIDGPAGAGKSTVAREVAARLGWCYLDTGAMYRAVALVALERGLPLEDAQPLAEMAESLPIDFQAGRVFLEGRDVSAEIRSDRVTQATRPVADAPPVREAMKQLQQRLAAGRDVVTEGRDQGSVVFPAAEVKIFLTASAAERARRRHREQEARGQPSSLAQVLADQTRRDEGDRRRPVGTMEPAADALILETDGLSPAEVVERLLAVIAARRRGGV